MDLAVIQRNQTLLTFELQAGCRWFEFIADIGHSIRAILKQSKIAINRACRRFLQNCLFGSSRKGFQFCL